MLEISKSIPDMVNCAGGLMNQWDCSARSAVCKAQILMEVGLRIRVCVGGRGMTRRSLSQERVIVGAEITQKPSYPSGEMTEDSFSLTQYSWLYFQFVDLGKLRASAGLSDLERRGSKPALSSLLEGLLISRKGKKQKRNSW